MLAMPMEWAIMHGGKQGEYRTVTSEVDSKGWRHGAHNQAPSKAMRTGQPDWPGIEEKVAIE